MQCGSLLERTVSDLVKERPSRSRILQRHGLDFCCGGGLPLSEACAKRSISTESILHDLDELDNETSSPNETDFHGLSLAGLVSNIIDVHHEHLRVELPRLARMLDRVCQVHGSRDQRLHQMRDIFQGFREELVRHMMKEESILFTVIVSMEDGRPLSSVCFPSVAIPISQMKTEHGEANVALRELRRLSDNFTPPEDACNTWRALLDGLNELDTDMQLHVHKENDVLFIRAIAMEQAQREGAAS